MTLSPGITSSSNALLRGRPMFSGMTVPGNTTMFRIGRIGSSVGTFNGVPAPVLMTVWESWREMIWESGI